MRLKPAALVALSSLQLLWAAAPKPVVINAVVDQYRPMPYESENLIGLFAARMRANTEGFLEQTGEKVTVETAPKYLEIASSAYEYRGDSNLKTLLDHAAAVLFSAPQASRAPSWLPGLLAYYRITGQGQALNLSGQIANSAISKGTANTDPSLVGPLTVLFRYTNESRYLAAAKAIADAALKAGKPSDAPADESALIQKLRLSAALVDLCRVTGDENYLQAAAAFWRTVVSRTLTLTGAIRTGSDSNTPASACATVAWMQLNLQLLEITGVPYYGSELEKTIYNQLFASQDPRTGLTCPSVSLNGTKVWSSAPSACDWEIARGISLIPSVTWGRYGNGVAVNLYTGGRATVRLHRRGNIQLYSEASFPETGQVLLHIEPDHNLQFPLRLRVPDWTSKFVAECGGSRLFGKPGQYLTISREWKKGDTVKLNIDLTAEFISGSTPNGQGLAIKRGPQVLALGVTLNPSVKDLGQAGLIPSGVAPALKSSERMFPSTWMADQAYFVDGEYNKEPARLTLVPFADAITYRVFLNRSERASSAALH